MPFNSEIYIRRLFPSEIDRSPSDTTFYFSTENYSGKRSFSPDRSGSMENLSPDASYGKAFLPCSGCLIKIKNRNYSRIIKPENGYLNRFNTY